MKNQPKEFQRFFIFILAAALVVIAYAVFRTEWNLNRVSELLVFGALAVASESLPVSLPKGGYVTVGYATFFSSVILFPSGISLAVGALGGLLVFGKASIDQPLFKRVFNSSQYVLSIAAAHVVLVFLGVSVFQFSVKAILVYISVALTYVITNMTIVSVALAKMLGKSPWSIWLSNIRWSIPNFLALAPLGLLMALIFKNYGPLGLALLTVPLLLSRHSFQRYMDMRENYLATIEALVQAIEAKDCYTRGHSDRVARLAVAMAEELRLAEDRVESVKYAAILHDVGKIGVSESILNKEEKLLEPEWDIIRNHPIIGQNIVKSIKFLYDIGMGVRHHHERYDGYGYPDGLKGEEIPLDARIIAVADCYDAMTSDRSYRGGRKKLEALEELRRVAGTQLDPDLVDMFCKVLPNVSAQEVSVVEFDRVREESNCGR